MKSFCYSARWANNGQKILGGCIHIESLEALVKIVPALCKVKLEVTGTKVHPRYRYMRDGREVYLSVSIHADQDEKAKALYDALPMTWEDAQ